MAHRLIIKRTVSGSSTTNGLRSTKSSAVVQRIVHEPDLGLFVSERSTKVSLWLGFCGRSSTGDKDLITATQQLATWGAVSRFSSAPPLLFSHLLCSYRIYPFGCKYPSMAEPFKRCPVTTQAVFRLSVLRVCIHSRCVRTLREASAVAPDFRRRMALLFPPCQRTGTAMSFRRGILRELQHTDRSLRRHPTPGTENTKLRIDNSMRNK